MRMRSWSLGLGILMLAPWSGVARCAETAPGGAGSPGRPAPKLEETEQADLKAARAVFERNLQAIRDKDRNAYLACYLDSERLARTGPDGSELGYAGLAATAGQGWPDHIAADDLKLTWVRAGLVYGTYRYRVRYGGQEVAGLSERLFTATPGGWRIAISTAFAANPGVPPPPVALVGATLLDGNGGAPLADAVVLLRDGKIECAGARPACPLPAGVDTLDLKGTWITPGVIDAHVHYSQTGWADGRPDSLDARWRIPYETAMADLQAHPDRYGRTELCSGVTSTFDVGGYAWTLDLPAKSEDDLTMPRVRAAGPLIVTYEPSELRLPAESQMILSESPEAARAGVRYLKARGSAAVKLWYIVQRGHLASEFAPIAQATGDEAKKAGLPLIVHAQGLAEAKESLKAGATLLVHGVRDLPVDEEFLDLAKKNGAVYCPTLTVSRGYLRMFQSARSGTAPRVDDPNRCVDPGTIRKVAETGNLRTTFDPEKEHALVERNDNWDRVSAPNLKKVADAGIPIAMGTDAGNPLTLHGPSVYAEMEAMQKAGLSPAQVLTAATRGSALAMGREKELGTIEKGKLADLLVVAADPGQDIANLRQLKFVVRGGAVRSIAELSALATFEAPSP